MSADPFLRLTHIWTDDQGQHSSPLFFLPEKVAEIHHGRVYVGDRSYVVLERAEEIHKRVIAKLAENKQAEVLGK